MANFAPQTVNASVSVMSTQGMKKLKFQDIPHPLTFDYISRRVMEEGYPRPSFLASKHLEHEVEVIHGDSVFNVRQRGRINLDQPLLHFYHQVFLPPVLADDPDDRSLRQSEHESYVSTSRITGKTVYTGGVNVRFHRTIRVPDNDKTHPLPPNLGRFELFNVGDHASRLPTSAVSKGGIFLSMYQREAMWISLKPDLAPCAVKISVGGINTLTGLPQNALSNRKQDYLAVNNENEFLWLDGISTAPGVVRQFVAMPLGQGYTIEGQLNGHETLGGIQIDVYRRYPTTVTFCRDGKELNILKTPRQLGIQTGTILKLLDHRYRSAFINLGTSKGFPDSARIAAMSVDFETRWSSSEGTIKVYLKSLMGKTYTIPCTPSTSVQTLKSYVDNRDGIPIDQQKLIFAMKHLEDDRPLSDYNVQLDSTLHLVLRLRGGGDSNEGDMLAGFAAGGRITQKINRDPLPIIAYDQSQVTRLHVTIINAAHFSSVTGLPNPPSPISAQTYIKYNLPWYKLYDENIPLANNVTTPTPLSHIQSIAQLDHLRVSDGQMNVQPDCMYCKYEMATISLQPCGHVVCDDCTTTNACPSCAQPITSRKRFAAPMLMPGNEDGDGVPSLDQRIVISQNRAKRSEIASFKLQEHAVSQLCGEHYVP